MNILRIFVTVVCLVVLVGLAGRTAPDVASPDATPDAAGIRIESAWIRPAPTAGGNGALYMTLTNVGDTSDRLLTVETSIAKGAELHETQNDNGVMRMRPVEGGVEIPAQQGVEFGPGGKHIMLLNVAEPLTVGQAVKVTLTFEKAGRVALLITVVDGAP